MKTVHLNIKLNFPDNYTEQQITDILTNCDYSFYYPTERDDTEVREIDSEIMDYEFK